MPLVKNGALAENVWTHLADDALMPGDGAVTVTAGRWLLEREILKSRAAPVGVRLSGGDDLEPLASDLVRLPLIAVDFPRFADGRGFSVARLLRGQYGHTGEVRAVGAFIPDQVFFLGRVGFDAFEFAEGGDATRALSLLKPFTVTYQSSADEPRPLYRRR